MSVRQTHPCPSMPAAAVPFRGEKPGNRDRRAKRFTLRCWGCLLLALTASAALAESLDERRQRVERMTPAEKEELSQRLEHFQALPPEERERLRKLNASLEQNPRGEALRAVLRHYAAWHASLPVYQRAELEELPPGERLARVKQWWSEEQKKAGKQLAPGDQAVVRRWFDELVARRAQAALERLPAQRRARLERIPAEVRRQFFERLTLSSLTRGPRAAPLAPSELTKLRMGLSEKARNRLDQRSAEEQTRIVVNWLRLLDRQNSFAMDKPLALSQETRRELMRYVEEELGDAERERLLGLPGDDMARELLRLYLLPREGPRPRPHRDPFRGASGDLAGARAKEKTKLPAHKSRPTGQPAPAPTQPHPTPNSGGESRATGR